MRLHPSLASPEANAGRHGGGSTIRLGSWSLNLLSHIEGRGRSWFLSRCRGSGWPVRLSVRCWFCWRAGCPGLRGTGDWASATADGASEPVACRGEPGGGELDGGVAARFMVARRAAGYKGGVRCGRWSLCWATCARWRRRPRRACRGPRDRWRSCSAASSSISSLSAVLGRRALADTRKQCARFSTAALLQRALIWKD